MGVGVGRVIAAVGRQPAVQRFVSASPVTAPLRSRFTNKDGTEAVIRARRLADFGVLSTLHMREPTSDAETFVDRTASLADRLQEISGADISVKMEQLGYREGGTTAAQASLERILKHCADVGVTVTLDMEHPDEVEDTLQVWAALQPQFPALGVAVQACLPRSERDCADLAQRGARVRLCKGGYHTPGDGSYNSRQDIDLAFVRCARRLMAGDGYPMIATHDPRMWEIVAMLARQAGRGPAQWEMQTLQGVAPGLVADAVAQGTKVRCYLPYGSQTCAWLVRRLSERPSNVLLMAAPRAWGDPLAFTAPEGAQ